MTQASASIDANPITADWKISEVLRHYPDLLPVLIDTTPAFEKLRNPLLRRVQSRLVTVGQAAQIAGIQPVDLVRTLNAAAGIETAELDARPAAEPEASAAPAWVASAPIAEELDVRPFQQRGEEPFSAIMAATRRIPRGAVLLLRNTFEPTPLYDVLGQRGFDHWAQKWADDNWEIRFLHTGSPRQPSKPAGPPTRTPQSDSWDEPTATLTIDVSELVPPEPMIRILTALEELPDGASLLVHHVRRPMHLYPRLDELGYRHETRELGPNRVEVLIEKTPPPASGTT